MSFNFRTLVPVMITALLFIGPLSLLEVPDEAAGREMVTGDIDATRSSQYYNSPTGGKWVYDFSEPDPLSINRNLSIMDGKAVLKDRFELDDFSMGTAGSAPQNWIESDASQGDLVLDDTNYGMSPHSAHYSTVNGGGGYSVSRTMTTIGSSDTIEVVFSIYIESISETTSSQGLSCRIHYTGQDDGAEVRFHSNSTVSVFGWDGSSNSDMFPGYSYDMDTWITVRMLVRMDTQDIRMWIGTDDVIPTGAPLRSTGGSDVLFLNTLTFETGSSGDGADFYMDDIFSTKNTIDSGSYTSPTISKTKEMDWQYLQVYPAAEEPLLSLSLLNVSSGNPYDGYDTITIPSNGRIDAGSLPGDVQNFRIFVLFRREGTRRPALDLVGASWELSGHFFDPLFPGTGLMRSDLEHVKEGMELLPTSGSSYETSGYVITPSISLTTGHIWGGITVDHDLPPGTVIAVDVIGLSDQNPLPGISTSHDGTIDLYDLGLSLQQQFRIKVSLSGDGSSSPTIKWISLNEPLNTDPYFVDASLDRTEAFRMSNVTLIMQFADDTDHPEDVDIGGEYLRPGSVEWESEYVSGTERNGSTARVVLALPSDSELGEYIVRGYAIDRSGSTIFTGVLALNVRNIKVSKPVIEMVPVSPFTDNILKVKVNEGSVDPEGDQVLYRYHWYINGDLVDPEDPDGPDVNYTPENTTSKESNLYPGFTTKRDNVSCMVVATDLIEDGPVALVFAIINNSPPLPPSTLISHVLEEDTPITVDLLSNFTDVDGDDLTFEWEETDEVHIQDQGNGTIIITPQKDLNGYVQFNVTASDDASEASTTVSLTYTPINDDPYIDPIMDVSISQGEDRQILVTWGDVESGPEAMITVTLPDSWGEEGVCEFDVVNSTILLDAKNGNVGNHTVTIMVSDKEGNEFELSFNISVININDPLEEVLISSPEDLSEYETGENITFRGEAVDPDIIHGQEMVYKWFLVTELIGTGKEIQYSFDEPGSYTVTLEISEGTSSRSKKVVVNITKKDDGGGTGDTDTDTNEGSSLDPMMIGIIVAVVVLLLIILLIVLLAGRRKKGGQEEAEEPPSTDVTAGPPVEKEPERVPEAIPPVPEPSGPAAVPKQEIPATQPIPEPEAATGEPEILMPSAEDILLPTEGPGDVQIPDIDIPIPPQEEPKVQEAPKEGEGQSNIEYFSPSKKE